jgi:6-phosphogluconolactonase
MRKRQLSARKIVSADEAAAAEVCAQHILAILAATARSNGRATLAVSGGSSPKLLFVRIAAAKFDWQGVHTYILRRRALRSAHRWRSNYKLAKEHLIGPGGIPEVQGHRVLEEIAPEGTAKRYADEVRTFFGLLARTLPSFDVIHRGMGPDAATASLYPGDPLIDDRAAGSVVSSGANGGLFAGSRQGRGAGARVRRRVRSPKIPVAAWNPRREVR